jgi:type IV secretion system protein VirB6
MGIGVAVEGAIDLILDTFVSEKSAALASALIPVALTGVTLHFLFTGRAIITGELTEPIPKLTWRIVRIAFIVGLALSVGAYQSNVVELANGLEQGMIKTLSGADSIGMLVDDLAKPYVDLGQQFWNRAVTGFWPNFGLLFAAGGVAVIQVGLFTVGLGMYLLAKIGLVLMLAIGPAYILCAIGASTQKYTESWLGQALNFVVLKILIALSIQTLNDFTSSFAAHINADMDAINVIKAVIALFCCGSALFVVMLNLPQIASALAGGTTISGIGRTIVQKLLFDWLQRKSRSSKGNGGGTVKHGGTRERPEPSTQPHSPLYQRNTLDHLQSRSTRRSP